MQENSIDQRGNVFLRCRYEMSTTVATMEKIYKSSEKTVGQNKSLSAAIRCVEDGPIPSINDALDGLHAIW